MNPPDLPESPRRPLHTRSIRVEAFARADGLFDLEAELVDVKAYDFERRRGTHRAGDPVHHMRLTLTLDDTYTIVAARAQHVAVPYDDECRAITPDYTELVGLNLLRGFRQKVSARFARHQGCTHMTELAQVLPTAAIQSMSSQIPSKSPASETEARRPFQIDGCHALRADGGVVQEHYPRWYSPTLADTGAGAHTGADRPEGGLPPPISPYR